MKESGKLLLFIIYLAALGAFAPFSTDIYLASMPTIQTLFHTSTTQVQLTLSLFFVGFALAQLVWGPLSDRIGRRAVVFIGLIVFIAGSLFCALSQSILMLIIARIIQAIGACSGIVIAIAMVKDCFTESKQMAKVLSSMLAVTILAPMIAPIIGSYLLVHLGWRSNFYFLASYGSLLLLSACFVKESYPKAVRKSLPVSKLLRAYWQQAKFTPFLLAMLAVSANFAVLFAFISSSSFIYIKIYHLAAHLFGYFFAFNAAGLILGNLSLNYLKSRLSDKKIIIGAILLSFFGILVMLIAILVDPKSIWSVACPLFVVTYGVGILYPELTAQALHHVIDYNGLASSLIGTCRFFLAAVLGVIMGLLIHRSALPLAIVMLILNGCLALFMLFYFQRTPSAQ